MADKAERTPEQDRKKFEEALKAPFKEWINSDYRWEQYPSSNEAWRAYLAGAAHQSGLKDARGSDD